MSRYSDQRHVLQTAGVNADPVTWKGGEGVVVAWGGTPAGEMQMSPDNGTTWVSVHMYGGRDGDHLDFTAAQSKNFKLPACKIRCSAAWTSGEMLVVSC